MSQKLSLHELRVSSFRTIADIDQVRGGSAHRRITDNCPTRLCPFTQTCPGNE